MREWLEEYRAERLDEGAMELCRKKWDSIAKPLHSLGMLEDYLVQIAGISGSANISLEKKGLIVMCADNGVVEEGVTQTGQEVTAIVTDNFLTGQATAAVLCKKAGADIFPVDIGVASDTCALNRKVAYGTKNIAREWAMTRKQALQALKTGCDMVGELAAKGYRILATGEMGIGNTTTSSALACAYLHQEPEKMTGRGAGLSSAGLEKKIQVIKKALELHLPKCRDAVDVLAAVGGLDIAGLAGVFLGGAKYRVPIVIDGFISAVAALTAVQICKECRDFMLASHISKEPATRLVLETLSLEAALHCNMCLGEGTGAVTLFPLLDMACEVYQKMSTFDDISVEAYQPLT
ncbi:nicotinate-nucleotide--dimethylbenzimidazole phosphoribosyltransferase [Marvinbryantia formatexigens]|nr:nicotinate-nucleotide--dimethylbenzimidazole phosphoribosyltransferase [Marvinbryantia formatexigens]UWO24686.1 nicotinate-nucleotide--dimethylbenzimidazole phosphoribosyltransferase [Marvinbryantia formatexigens DSM 14469]SDF18863.1 nicotinate-nucleotide-dimethylbenzimidazole phosphoribosyltransferase [Marvinbryantia formatexigens]